ncbi:chemotaxis protein CheW [Amantichitinum ursilacus]|uniref:Chemotaxis protein CheW n=1 Tax=Amantichitinum ursilacus TaxID=857265 RepID=A0A0N0XJE9_9NEIS|nr:chemotaxis protein CheW [Amantichitinum ursilacus]KPC50698.1 Chemotaxis protein CheW [Amantichitinum ursilacus]
MNIAQSSAVALAPAPDEAAPALGGDYLLCCAARQRVGLPLTAIAAVIRPGTLTPLPLSPNAVLGLINWQGSALPVFALSQLLAPGNRIDQSLRGARIVVLQQPSRCGLWVDAVDGAGAEGWSLGALADLLRSSVVLPSQGPVGAGAHLTAAGVGARAADSAADPDQDLLVFSVNAEYYALPLQHVEQVARQLTPAMAALPQLQLRAHWEHPAQAQSEWLAVRHGNERVALAVDRLRTILRVPASALRALPPLLAQRGDLQDVSAVYHDPAAPDEQVTVLDLDRLLSNARVQASAASAEVEEEKPMAVRNALEDVLVLRMGEHRFALPISAADAVVRLPATLQPVPGAPAYVRGLLQWRGQSVPVLDYRALLNQSTDAAIPASARVLILPIGGVLSGLLVDEMREMFTLHADELIDAPALQDLQAQLIKQLIHRGEHTPMLPLLQADALVHLDAAGALRALMAEAP